MKKRLSICMFYIRGQVYRLALLLAGLLALDAAVCLLWFRGGASFWQGAGGTALLVVTLAVPALLVGCLLSKLLRFQYPVELTVAVNSSMRNNAAAATIAAQYFPSEVVFSPSVSPLFSQFTISLAVQIMQKRQVAKEKSN